MKRAKKQKLGLVSLTALVTGNMIGSGIFILPADLARIGSISLFSWIFTACGAFLLALVFSKMSSVIPKTGGPYSYATSGFGEFLGFQTAYVYWIAIWVGNASIALALAGYLRIFLPQIANPVVNVTLAIGVIWLFTLINITGIRSIGLTQVVTTICKLLPLLALIIFGWEYFHPEYLTNFFNITQQPNFTAFSHAASLTLWAFIGVESATVPAGSTENPRRDIPLATLFGTVIATIFYIAISTIVMGIVPASELANSTAPVAAAAAVVFGHWGLWMVALGAIISCCGTLNGWILVQGQIALAAADDKLFPHIFAKCNKVNMPVWNLLITAVLMSVLLLLTNSPNLVDQLQMLILVAITGTLIVYFYTAMAEIVWIMRNDAEHKMEKAHVIIALFAAVYAAWAFFGSGKNVVFYVTMLLFSSVPCYALVAWGKRRRKDVSG